MMTNRTILYVDDEEKNLTSFKAVFRKDFDVLVASSAEEGLFHLKENNVQIVVSDQRMPNLSGVEFLERIKEEFPDIIRIIITGFSDYQVIVDSINKASVYKYLPKPWKKEEFKDILDKAFEVHELRVTNRSLVEELRKVNKELDHFLYSTGHDLMAPVATIKGLITLAKNESDVTTIRDLISKKEKTINKLDYFIRQINQYARNVRSNEDPKEIWFEKLIANALESLKDHERYPLCKIEITVRQDQSFFSDQQRLRDVFLNVLTNALNFYMPNEITTITISVAIQNDIAIIYVIDNGTGINSEVLPKIFEMFYKGSVLSSGAGLGLFLARESLFKINGQIEVESELGKGTQVKITVPNSSQ